MVPPELRVEAHLGVGSALSNNTVFVHLLMVSCGPPEAE
jgi:hypothetical protein